MRDGGGTRRPLDKPERTASSQPQASANGTSNPTAGRASRDQGSRRFSSAWVCSTATLIGTRDIKIPAEGKPSHPAKAGQDTPERADRSVRYRDVTIIDQVVERLLHVDVGRDDAGLLERD